jgi:signal peptidase I
MRKLSAVLVVVGVILLVFIICNFLGLYSFYKTASVDNEPSLKFNKMVSVTNLKSPKTGDIIAYRFNETKRMHRIMAGEGDIIEIKRGRVFVNDKDFDKDISTMHTYKINKHQYLLLKPEGVIDPLKDVRFNQVDYSVFIEDRVADKYNFSKYKLVSEEDETSEEIRRIFGKNWNKDNFGPLLVPQGKVFVMGDNRDNSEDSRYLGFIDSSDILGVVID